MQKTVIVFIRTGQELTKNQTYALSKSFGSQGWQCRYIDKYTANENALINLANETQSTTTVHVCTLPLLLLLTNNKKEGYTNYVLYNEKFPFGYENYTHLTNMNEGSWELKTY